MKRTFYVWAGCFVALAVLAGTLGAWNLPESALLPISCLIVIIAIASVFVFGKKSDKEFSSSISILQIAENEKSQIICSYSAYYFDGEFINTPFPGDPSVVDFTDETIRICVEDGKNRKIIEYDKDHTEVLWVGDSGRPKDCFNWLLIKSPQRASLVSVFSGTDRSSNSRCTKELYFNLLDRGYRTGIDNRKRGLFNKFAFIALLIILTTKSIADEQWLFLSFCIFLTIYVLATALRVNQGPGTRNSS
jgi:hypothetical protein